MLILRTLKFQHFDHHLKYSDEPPHSRIQSSPLHYLAHNTEKREILHITINQAYMECSHTPLLCIDKIRIPANADKPAPQPRPITIK